MVAMQRAQLTRRPQVARNSINDVLCRLLDEMEYAAALMDVQQDSDPEQAAMLRRLAEQFGECQGINASPESYGYLFALLVHTQRLLSSLSRADLLGNDVAAAIGYVRVELEGALARISEVAPSSLHDN